MTSPATVRLCSKSPDQQFRTDSSSVSTASYYGASNPLGIAAFGTTESLSLSDDEEIPASGVVIRPPKESGNERQVMCLWRAVAVPAGLISLGTFFALEADRTDLGTSATTSSWESPHDRYPLRTSQITTQLSLNQASSLALQVFANAEKEIQDEREAEARFLERLWQDEDL